MKKILICLLAGLSLAACNKQENIITCGEYEVAIEMNETGDKIHAVINGDEMDLDLAISASGARYVGILNDTTVTLWNKGSDWTMFLNDEEPIFCK